MSEKLNNIILAIILIASVFCNAQEFPKEPKRFPGKFGVYGGVDLVDYSNTSNASIYLKKQDIVAPVLGVKYSFGDFKFLDGLNLNIGFKVRNFSSREETFIRAEEIVLRSDLEFIFTQGPNWTYHLPIDFHYTFNKESRTQFFTGAGFELQLYGYTPGAFSNASLIVVGSDIIISEYRQRQRALTNGVNFLTGLNLYGPGGSKFQLELKYHRHFQTMQQYSITATNLRLSPDARSDHDWTGHYTSLTLTYFPSFKFNNPKRK
jgi:hypothetical protein